MSVASVAVSAQTDTLDGVYTVTTGEYASLYTALPSPSFQHNEKTVRALIQHVMKDGRVSAEELDAYRELTRQDVSQVMLVLNGTSHKVPVARGAARELLLLASDVKVDMNALWDGGAQGRRKLYQFYSLSLSHKNHVQRFVASKLQLDWKKSNINNQYMPLRRAIGIVHKQNEDEISDMHGEACGVLYDSARLLDRHLKDSVPDHVYSWLPSHIKAEP